MQPIEFSYRPATMDDVPELKRIMKASIEDLQKGFLDDTQVRASHDIMGLDTQLIQDGTYFAVLAGSQIVGCGGWSRRATLFGGDHTAGRNAALLNPKIDPARVRAMYTDPQWARKGIGKLIMQLCENAARSEGFLRVELAATLAGEPLYTRCGYKVIKRWNEPTRSGPEIPLLLMGKTLVSDE